MSPIALALLGVTATAQMDTMVVLGAIERDMTGDGEPEILRLVGTGPSLDSLEVRFTITSGDVALYQIRLAPSTRILGFGGGRRELSAADHRAHMDGFGAWFFDDSRFIPATGYSDYLRSIAPAWVGRVPAVMARDRRAQLLRDSLAGAGYPAARIERRIAELVVHAPVDAARADTVWQEMRGADVPVFTFSPGGDRVLAIAWSARDRRFYHLIECC